MDLYEAWYYAWNETVTRNKFTSHGLAFFFLCVIAMSLTAWTRGPGDVYTAGLFCAIVAPPVWEIYDRVVNSKPMGVVDMIGGFLFGVLAVILGSAFL